MSYGLAFGFPRNNTLAATASPFSQLGPTLDLVFTGVGSTGVPAANNSLDLNFVGDAYSVSAPYMVWGSTGMTAENFQDIVTFTRATGNATYYNSSGYLTTAGVWNYLTYSNQPENAAWTKSNSFVQQNLLLQSQDLSNAYWGKSNCTVSANAGMAPDGTTTANLITVNTTAFTFINVPTYVTAATAATNTFVMSVMAGTVNSLSLGLYDGTTFGSGTAVIVSGPGSLTQQSGSRFLLSGLSASQWTRVAITRTTASAGTGLSPFIYPRDQSSSNAGDTIYVWGAQLVQGSVPGDYRATTTTALPILYPDYTGALRARKLCENDAVTQAHRIQQVVNLSGTSVTLSQRLKAGERTWAYLRIDDAVSTKFAYFNLSAGTVGSATAPLTSTITSVGGGWYVCTATFASPSATASGTYVVGAAIADGVNSYTGDGSSGIYIADAQLELGTVAGPYFDTTQYPYNAPRFDYDPVTLLPRGLLIEEQRTNLLFQSNDFFTSWSPTNITRTLNSILSPDGNINGVKIEATTSAGTALYQQVTSTSTSHSYSVYVKQGTSATTANNFIIRNITTLTNLLQIQLNFSTGAITYIIGSTGAVVTSVGNGWWRIALTVTTGITVGDLVAGYVGFTGGVFTAGDFLYAYGAQLEAGALATSYIPTTTSQLTRAGDNAVISTLSPWFNAATGAIYASGTRISSSVTGSLVEFGDGTNNNRFFIYGNQSGPSGSYIVYNGGVSQASLDVSPAFQSNTLGKIAAVYAANDFQQATNGALSVADTSGTVPTVTGLYLGRAGSIFGVSGVAWNGWIQRITYYPRRLSNTELQTLTTL